MDNDYHELGNSLQSSGRFDEAVAAYQQAVELNPDFCAGALDWITSAKHDSLK